MKKVAIAFAVAGTLICAFVVWHELGKTEPRLLELGNLVVLTLTLIVLLWYAYDTNSIAHDTRDRWVKEGVLATTYELGLPGASVGDKGRTIFKLHNGSPLVVRAKVNFNFKVYGQPVAAGPLFEGKQKWLLYPHQISQGAFEVASLLKQQGKNVNTMQAEVSDENREKQMTMLLEMTFVDEFGTTRTLPARFHYFDFRDWAWIPSLSESGGA